LQRLVTQLSSLLRELLCATGLLFWPEAATGQTLFASLFQTGCARECYSNCKGKATEFVNNGSNINGKFIAINNKLNGM